MMRLPVAPSIFCVVLAAAPPDVLADGPAKLLMPFFGLFMAGIFPAISLTINSLKAGGFSVQRVEKLAEEMGHLLDYLQLLFVIALVSALTLVVGEITSWGRNFVYHEYTSRSFNAVLGFCLGSLISSLPKVRKTFKILLNLTKEIAVDEAQNKLKDRASKIPSNIDRYPTKEKFGELFEASRIDPPTR